MNCKKQNKQKKSNVITRVPNILKRQKAFWFLFPCALSPCAGMPGVSSLLLFIGVLLRLASCLFAWYLQKNASCVRNLLPSFFFFSVCLQLWTSRGSHPQFLLFLVPHSVCCTLNPHTGLFLQCTIKNSSCVALFS